MTKEKQVRDDSEDPDAWWDELPASIREGFREEAEMWKRVQALEAEIRKPKGLLGLLGYRTNTGCW